MATIYPYPRFTFLFAAVLRTDPQSRPIMLRTTATSETFARYSLADNYILVFADRLPAVEVRYA